MSYSSIVLARANWCKGDLHQWITAVNIDISPPGIHGLACKKLIYLLQVSSTWTNSELMGEIRFHIGSYDLRLMKKCCDSGINIGIPIVNMRRSHDSLIFTIEIPYLKRLSLYWNGTQVATTLFYVILIWSVLCGMRLFLEMSVVHQESYCACAQPMKDDVTL